MAKRSFVLSAWTPVAVADTANFTDNGHQSLKGGTSTQRTLIHEIYVGGQATDAAPTHLKLARHSTVGATLTSLGAGQSDAALDPATDALVAPVVPFTASTTKPQASATLGLLNFSFNAFGGLVRWQGAPDALPAMFGNTASFGELGLNAYTGGTPGAIGSHIIYETL